MHDVIMSLQPLNTTLFAVEHLTNSEYGVRVVKNSRFHLARIATM